MKGKRHTETEIINALQRNEAGVKVAEICRELGVVEQTFYRWRSKFGGMSVSEARRLKALEAENGDLKRLLADLVVENDAIKAVLSKKW